MNEAKYVPSKEAEAILDGVRLLDDNFMTMFFDQNFEATCLLLNVILGRNDIQIKSMEVQKNEKNASVGGRNVIMDIFAADSEGKYYDIEVQRADKGAGRKRARFLSAVLDSRMLKTGDEFESMCDSYVIFITENDVLNGGHPIYHVNRCVKEFVNEKFDDGNHIIYVNGAYKDDSSDIGRLMHDFRCTSSVDMFYDVLKEGMHHYKETEGGRATVCRAIEAYGEEQKRQGEIIGEINGEMRNKIETALKMLKANFDVQQIADLTGLPVSKVEELRNLIPA